MPNSTKNIFVPDLPPRQPFFVLDGLPLMVECYHAAGPRVRTPAGEPAWVTCRHSRC